MDFLSSQTIIYTSEKYEGIYMEIANNKNIRYHDIFLLACSIGFRNGRRSPITRRGREFRSNYLSSDEQKTTIYTILLEDPYLNIRIEDLTKKEKFGEFKKVLEEYAEGGMDILVEEVFPPNIHINTKGKAYKNYIIDIMSYVYEQSIEVPF